MRKNNILILAITVALMFSIATAQVDQLGARPLGTGGAYTAMAQDANAPAWNPAAMEAFRNLAFTASYARLYLGIDNDGLNEGYAGFVNHLGLYGQYGSYGLSFAQYFSDIYSQMFVTLGYAKRLYGSATGPHLSLGANFKLIRSGFNEANFEDFDPTDDVFSAGYSSMAYSADAGLYFKPARWITIGAVAKDVLEPDISISGSGTDADKLPMTVRGGLALYYKGFTPTFDIEYRMRNINGESDMKFHAGLEKWFGRSFALRGGLNRDEAAFGLSYMHKGERFGWGLDYTALYPALTEMAPELITTHRVGVNITLDPPPPPIRDLELVGGKVEITPKRTIIANEVEIRTMVENRGEVDENGVRVSVYYKDAADKWRLAFPVGKYDFAVGEKRQISWKWSPPAKGHYTIFVSVDDKGDRIPEINGRIREENEDNNTGSGELVVFLTPEGLIAPRDEKLSVSKLTLYQEEEPIIPVVFFGKGSSAVDTRFDDMLKTVAQRLKENPDVVVYIRGYYDESSDPADGAEALAVARGRATYDKLRSFGVPDAQLKLVDSGYYLAKERAGIVKEQKKLNPKDAKLMEDENRRAELTAWFADGKDFLAEISIKDKNLSSEATSTLGALINKIKYLLDANPEAIVIAESYYQQNTPADEDRGFEKVAVVGRYLKNQLGEAYHERIRIHTSFAEQADPDQVLVFPNSEGVIWRPKIGDRVFTDYRVEGSEENLVRITANVDAGVDSFGVVIVDETGRVVRNLAAGKGEIPSGLAWDWRNNSGELLDFDHKYFCRLDIRDKMGESFLTYSDTMEIIVTKEAKRIESLVIVLFEFDEEIPTSKFLETRIEYVAQRFISRAERSNTRVTALIVGHTDPIGAEYANIKLSNSRAERELRNLRRYIMYLLNMDSQARLDKWFAEKNVSIKAKGLRDTQPYNILRWTGNTVARVLLGNNAMPEGRNVNRRVLLEMESETITK